MINQVILGDAIDVLKTLPDNSIDALITDPPAGVNFMQREFDSDRGGMIPWVNWLSEILNEAHRVMKPGACGVVWSLPRTCGWTQLAIELAGFRVVDSVACLFGSGFPKNLDISKAIDKMHGEEREVIGKYQYPSDSDRPPKTQGGVAYGSTGETYSRTLGHSFDRSITAPSHPDAKKWDGWKSVGLKPAHETWFLIQKKCEGTIARNILKYGTGGVNISACKIPLTQYDHEEYIPNRCGWKDGISYQQTPGSTAEFRQNHSKGAHQVIKPDGRFPANTILICSPDCTEDSHSEGCPVHILGEQGGERKNGGKDGSVNNSAETSMFKVGGINRDAFAGDTGTAARYFKQLPFDRDTFIYSTKASKNDRSSNGAVNNTHPTVKNTSLLRYFARLITPPNGVILDCFGGSGTTAIAAIEEGFNYVLIEKEEEYRAIAEARIAATIKNRQLSLEV